MKCKDCEYLGFVKGTGNPSRYYCENPVVCKERLCGAVLVSRCDRHYDKLKIKTSPRWCPFNGSGKREIYEK